MTQKPPVVENQNNDDVKIIKASYILKIKVGSGGFDPRNVKKAEKTLSEATHMFPSVAAQDMSLIKETILQFQQEKGSIKTVRAIQGAAAELKSHGAMFQFPLVSKVAESLLEFCEKIDDMTPLAEQVMILHLRTLQVAIDEGPRAINEKDRVELLKGLERACEKALKV